MKINKQLFEDVLSGKLKGTFVLRDGNKISLNTLRYNYSGISGVDSPLILNQHYYIYTGICTDALSSLDIIDFIPYKDMKENELTIEIPDNKVVDWEESKKQNKIVLKDKQLTYRDICRKLFNNEAFYYIKPDGSLGSAFVNGYTPTCGKTEHQLKCILAKNQLANVAVYLNDGWKPTMSTNDFGYFIFRNENYNNFWINACDDYMYDSNVLFKSKELAQQAIEILGEETIKLALEPLGI